MKSLVFDSGPVISLAMNNLLWLLESLKKLFRGEFYIPESVKAELVDDPLQSKKFKFEALQVQGLLNNGTFKVLEDGLTKQKTLELLRLANSCFKAKGRNLTLVHYGEVASVVAASHLNASALVMDERITRELIEHPSHLAAMMGKKLRTSVEADRANIEAVRQATQGIQIIRSTELAAIAFENGLLDRYLTEKSADARKTLIESVLWGLKLKGCAINERGIKAIIAAELKR